jgi:hydroxymethylpyrimidine/phosphomethylpyrimidine kinase
VIAPDRLARVLIAAGSDSGGGAGIQADIKTVTALGAYAATAVTALTVQDTRGVHAIHPVPPAFIARQLRCVLDDIGADAIKTGMLGDDATIDAVAGAIPAGIPYVLDPVMVAKGGAPLLPADAIAALIARLIPRATLLTPNIPEAELLTGRAITTQGDMRDAAAALLALGVPAILLKGGHLDGGVVIDLLATADTLIEMRCRRIDTLHTHGTGCTLASAIATGLAQGMRLEPAIRRARAYVHAAILAAPGFGSGHGPLNHMVQAPI